MSAATDAVVGFIRAFGEGDLRVLRESLTADFTGHVTTGDGGVRDVDRDGYIESVRAMDVPTAQLELAVPNVVEIEPGRVLVMVEVHAQRGGRSLHNFSGQLLTVEDGKVSEIWMVDALPAESDAFWS